MSHVLNLLIVVAIVVFVVVVIMWGSSCSNKPMQKSVKHSEMEMEEPLCPDTNIPISAGCPSVQIKTEQPIKGACGWKQLNFPISGINVESCKCATPTLRITGKAKSGLKLYLPEEYESFTLADKSLPIEKNGRLLTINTRIKNEMQIEFSK